jgi:ribosomal protein L13
MGGVPGEERGRRGKKTERATRVCLHDWKGEVGIQGKEMERVLKHSVKAFCPHKVLGATQTLSLEMMPL